MINIETVIALIERFLFRRSTIGGYPFSYELDVSGVCNLRCPKCVQHDKSKLHSGLMSLQNFKIIFEKIKNHARVMSFNNWGDPFFNKDVFEMIKMASDYGIKTFCSSNLTYLTEDKLDSIIESGLCRLTASIDGASPETYSKYRIGGDFAHAIKMLRTIQFKKFYAKSKTPLVTWQFIVNRFNEHEIEKAKKMAQAIGVEFSVIPMRPKTWLEPLMTDAEKLEDLKDWFPINAKQYSYEETLKNGKYRHCFMPWVAMIINWDGHVYPCTSLYGYEYSFGNMITQSLDDVWNGPSYRSSRLALIRKKDATNKFICGICKLNNGICK